MGLPSCVIYCFFLAAVNICSFCLIFINLINMCLGVFPLGFVPFRTLWISWTWVTISFLILGKFSTIFSSSIFSWQRRQWHPTPVLLPGKSHGRRSLVGCRPWGREESDKTEQLPFHFSLSCNGEGNGNPFQCSCLENPMDRGAWWAAVYGVAQSWTQLKLLSSSKKLLLATNSA